MPSLWPSEESADSDPDKMQFIWIGESQGDKWMPAVKFSCLIFSRNRICVVPSFSWPWQWERAALLAHTEGALLQLLLFNKGLHFTEDASKSFGFKYKSLFKFLVLSSSKFYQCFHQTMQIFELILLAESDVWWALVFWAWKGMCWTVYFHSTILMARHQRSCQLYRIFQYAVKLS